MREQEAVAAVIQVALVKGCALERLPTRGGLIPLLLVRCQVLVER